jgi:hypothetical protein
MTRIRRERLEQLRVQAERQSVSISQMLDDTLESQLGPVPPPEPHPEQMSMEGEQT